MDNQQEVEAATINLYYARLELTTISDPGALERALRHIDEALAGLAALMPCRCESNGGGRDVSTEAPALS